MEQRRNLHSTHKLLRQCLATATANTFGNTEFYIPNYTSSNYKSFSVDGVTENNATAAFALYAGLWSNTAAITSFRLNAIRRFQLFLKNTAPLIYTEYPTHNERKTMPTKLIVDCSTGITTEVELTAEEIAEREAMAAEYAVQKAQEDAAKAAAEAAKASAQSKLAALGLTADEIAALSK
jgi:hypothetical protein